MSWLKHKIYWLLVRWRGEKFQYVCAEHQVTGYKYQGILHITDVREITNE